MSDCRDFIETANRLQRDFVRSILQAVDTQLKELNIDGIKVTVDYIDASPGWVIEPPTVSYDEVEGTVSIS